ncbi:splicing regulator SDE2 isoform X2 [Narcine bancroftii]|uniref:splicing regulator SDE2 isoform X2 n=1 Tax=Narcine bancroftii TaxID=1343680 RepID=UPI003831C089
MEVWVRGGGVRSVAAALPPGSSGLDLKLCLYGQGIPAADVYLTCNGKLVGEEVELQDGATYSLETRLVGGKGGFGSMLRALGAQIEKTTNREACRDLSGRRLRDVNHEKAMAEWIKKQAERETEKEQRRLERLQRRVAEPKHYFTDPKYEQQLDEMSERLEDSVLKGLQASSSEAVAAEGGSRKRACPTTRNTGPGKKSCLWMGVEGLEGSGSSDEECMAESCSLDSSSHSGSSEVQAKVACSHASDPTDGAPEPSASPDVPDSFPVQQSELSPTEPEPSDEAEAKSLVSPEVDLSAEGAIDGESPKETADRMADTEIAVDAPAATPSGSGKFQGVATL